VAAAVRQQSTKSEGGKHGIDYCGGGGKQRRLMAIGSKMPTTKAIVVAPPTPLLSLEANGGERAAVAAARE
jgi:hypothetical protein